MVKLLYMKLIPISDEQVTIIATTLNDLYGWDIDQDTQVYPLNSDFVIIEE